MAECECSFRSAVRYVEVHGNDGADHARAAKRWAEQNFPASEIIEVRMSGQRCSHGYPVWAVRLRIIE